MSIRSAGAVALAIFLAGSVTASGQTNIRIGVNDDPDQLDPALSQALVTRIVLTLFCDKLFDINERLEIIPRLAESHSWSDDGLVLTLKLRPNVTFHDGEPFDAEAVKYNFERNTTLEGSFRKTELSVVDSVEAVDPLTVSIKLKSPSAPFLSIIADRAGMMISPKAGQALGERFGTAPACAGPFKFVSRVPQGLITFEKFDDYWDSDNVHIDKVEILAVNDTTIRLSNLQSGEFQIIERLSPSDVALVESNPALKLATAPDIGYGFIQFNVGNGPRSEKMKDKRVREAIDLALDRETLVRVAFDGHYIPSDQFIPTGSFYHDETRPLSAPDVERARQILDEAGVKDFTFELLVRPDRDFQVPAQMMQAMLAEAGINMVIQTTENVTQLEMARQGNFEAYTTAWSGRIDPDGNTSHFLTCGSSLNRMHYCNEQVDALLASARETSDPEKRKALYKEALDIVYEERPIIALWYRKQLTAMSARVEGYNQFADGMIRLQGVRISD